MSKARFILVALICAAPFILLLDGLVMQGVVAGVIAVALVITAVNLRPGETEFLISVIRPVAVVVAVPALWVLVQVLPLGIAAHPIWTSSEAALGHPVTGSISIDPGASIVAFGQYLSIAALGLVSAAVAVDRQRAEWILFALTGGTAALALMLLLHEFFYFGSSLIAFARAQAVDCASIGAIIASAACMRTLERYETLHMDPTRSVSVLFRTFFASIAALAVCGTALVLSGTREVLVASGCGIATFAGLIFVRRSGVGTWGLTAIASVAILGVILLFATLPFERSKSLLSAFATSPTGASERVLEDAPLPGTGAGTFAALAPIYRGIDDPPSPSFAPTAAATLAIELGQPMLWLIATAAIAAIIALMRASQRRGRDSFYPAMGASCLVTLFLITFVNAGLLATVPGLIAAAALGLAFAQSKSRTRQR